MTDFHYGNTRLRAMKSRLLSRAALVELTAAAAYPESRSPEQSRRESQRVNRFLNALTETPYRTAVEAALVQYQGLACLQVALQRDLVQTGQKIRSFFSGKAALLVAASLQRYDIHNMKTILRGLAHNLSAGEILANVLPLGEFHIRELETLAAAGDMQAAIDLLVTWRTPLAQSLLAKPLSPAGLPVLDRALEQWYFDFVMDMAAAKDTALHRRLLLETDVTNILTALRLVGVAELNSLLQQHFGSDDVTELFLGPGQISLALLAETAGQPSVSAAVATLANTAIGTILQEAMPRFQATRRLSVFEHALYHFQLQDARRLFIRDPLGIGLLLGYLALKTTEIINLRLIGHGLALGDTPEQIQEVLL